MNRLLLLLAFLTIGWTALEAQIPDGSTAPNFTVTDVVNGGTYTLYDLLDEGKVVYLDFFATWCGPCWSYHNSGALEGIWEEYGPPGTGEAFVIAIESDPSTNVNCIFGPSGCVGGTQGNWAAGTPYPIADAASVAGSYQIGYYPTIMMVCPDDKKVYESGQLGTSGLWSFKEQKCVAVPVSYQVNNVKSVKCFGTNTGAIDIAPGGPPPPFTYLWSNGATSQDLNNVPAGTYTCVITGSNGQSATTDPIEVEGPGEPLSVDVVETTPVGCNGILGSITVQANGGWNDNYTYVWTGGQQGETAFNLPAGNYTVSVTDANGCTKTLTANLPPATLPTASIATPSTITCTQPSFQLNATASSQGDEFEYQWFANNGGNIVSGGTTMTPTIDAAGTYVIQVTNTQTTCKTFANVQVTANIAAPTASAGPQMTVSCPQPTATLQGSGSSGSSISYLWTASNGGNIVSGAGTLAPVVNGVGNYTLKVTDATNGCSSTSTTSVTGFNTPPSLATAGGTISCAVTSVVLNTTTGASDPGFSWTGPNGFTSTQQSPTVTAAGDYTLSVLDSVSGCTATASATVVANNTAPGATATGGTLTCVVNSVTLNGTTNGTDVSFAWTGPNGFTSTAQNPSVADAGNYVLVVLDSTNSCTSTATAVVSANTTAPTASAMTPGNLNCNASQIQLNGTASSQGTNFSYNWTTGTGNIVSGGTSLTPLVDATGTYTLEVLNTANGCTATASTAVAQSPAVSAAITGQTNISCFGGSNGTAVAAATGGNNNYTYVWSNGASSASIENLVAGTYYVTAIDGENCSSSATVLITQPDQLAVNATATAQSANGVNDGTATANPSGGTATYQYLWSNSATTQTISDLAPGVYSVSITDANGCIAVQTVTVNAFNCALSASISGANVTCAGAANGTAAVSLVGGADPVSYVWSNGATTASVENLAPGEFSVNITDANNCPATLNISIVEPAALVVNATSTHESTSGANDGTATANPTGGTGDYTYLWSNNETTQSISGLAPGLYTVSVTDGNNCLSVQTVTVNSFDCAISAVITATNVSCFGLSNGIAIAVPVGGAAPFDYLWTNGATTSTNAQLSAGTYGVTITDDNDCPTVQTITITEPQALSLGVVSVNGVVCEDDPSGSAEVAATGGTSDYQYLWSNNASGPVATGLVAGDYSVVVTDANGCSQQVSVSITANDTEAPSISLQHVTIALGADGTIELNLQNLLATASDNCALSGVVINPAVFDCDQLGEHEIMVTATDESGNATSATTTVEVVDNLSPVLTCPASITQCAEDNIVNYTSPVAVDNCLAEGGGWNLQAGLPSGSEFPVGVTTQTYTYTDPSGNTGACSFDVIILTPANIAVASVFDDFNSQGIGSIDITVTGGTAPYDYKWYKDGVSFSNTEDLGNLNAGVYFVEVTDANGCLVSSNEIVINNTSVTVEPEWLRGVQLRPNPTSGITRIVFAAAPDKALDIFLSDATGRIVMQQSADYQSMVELDCSGLADGVYFVQFRTGQEFGVRRLVVSH